MRMRKDHIANLSLNLNLNLSLNLSLSLSLLKHSQFRTEGLETARLNGQGHLLL